MEARTFAAHLTLAAFILAALFGLYGMLSFTHAEHGGCPISPSTHATCVTPLKHLDHWQEVFTAVFTELFALLAVAALGTIGIRFFADIPKRTERINPRHQSLHPPLMRELFARGILHRKEPSVI